MVSMNYRSARASGITVLTALIMAGCAGQYVSHETGGSQVSNAGRYSMDQDRGPDQTLTADEISEVTPRVEPRSRQGNASPYTVNGRQYQVMASADQYAEEGLASWYGAKFHGHTTSNGEVFDMYKISAAHKSLPLPTWVRVTNLDNGLSIVARVNDRGPFSGRGRVIDLSRGAAEQLGVRAQGHVPVRVRLVDPPEKDRARLRKGKAAPARPSVPEATLRKLRAQLRAAGL